MKKRLPAAKRLRWLAPLLALVFLLTSCSSSAFGTAFPFLTEAFSFFSGGGKEPPGGGDGPPPAADGRRTVSFREMTYVRPDGPAIAAEIRGLATQVENAASFETLMELDETCEAMVEEYYTMYTLAELYSYLDTGDSAAEEEFRYIEEIDVDIENAITVFNRAIVEGPFADAYKQEVGEYSFEAMVEALRLNAETVSAYKQERAQLKIDYSQALNTLTITHKGQEYTLDEIDEMDAASYFVAVEKYYAEHTPYYAGLYARMIELDILTAETLGFDSAADMYYLSYARDYTPQDALDFCEDSKSLLAPLVPAMLFSGYSGEAVSQSEMFDQMPTFLAEVDPELVQAWDFMLEYDLHDFDPKPKKHKGIAFTTSFAAYDAPYIYGYWTDDVRSATTLIHEFGHFYSRWLQYETPNSTHNLDREETYSQGLELLLQRDFGDFLDDPNAATLAQLADFLQSLTYQALLEEFQILAYELDEVTPETLGALFTDLLGQYGYGAFIMAGADGYDQSWLQVTHLFEAPFYTISYATSACVALQMWDISLDDWDAGAQVYLDMIHADQNQPFSQLVESVGLLSPKDPDMLEIVAQTMQSVFASLAA